jgi:hypothetical protein
MCSLSARTSTTTTITSTTVRTIVELWWEVQAVVISQAELTVPKAEYFTSCHDATKH